MFTYPRLSQINSPGKSQDCSLSSITAIAKGVFVIYYLLFAIAYLMATIASTIVLIIRLLFPEVFSEIHGYTFVVVYIRCTVNIIFTNL